MQQAASPESSARVVLPEVVRPASGQPVVSLEAVSRKPSLLAVLRESVLPVASESGPRVAPLELAQPVVLLVPPGAVQRAPLSVEQEAAVAVSARPSACLVALAAAPAVAARGPCAAGWA